MSPTDWQSVLKYSILAVATVLLCAGFWLESVPPLREAWKSTKLNRVGSNRSVWRRLCAFLVRASIFVAGPTGYMLCLLANVAWSGVSASLAKTSSAPFPINLLDDSLVATQLAVLLTAGALVVHDGRFLTLHRDDAGPSERQRMMRWAASMLVAGLISNGLALLDSHVHVVNGDVKPPSTALGWYWINGVTITGFALGAALVFGASLFGLQRVFDRWVGLGSFVVLASVGIAARLTGSF